MTPTLDPRRTLARVRLALTDMSYAQRRVFEQQTGVAAGPDRHPVARTPSELEELYAQGPIPDSQRV